MHACHTLLQPLQTTQSVVRLWHNSLAHNTVIDADGTTIECYYKAYVNLAEIFCSQFNHNGRSL